MKNSDKSAKIKAISIARMRVTRATTGKREVYYETERVPLLQFKRWWRLYKHLRFMKREDKKWLSGCSMIREKS